MTHSLVGNARSDGGLGDLRAWRTYFVGTERQINDATDQQGGEETKLRMRKKRRRDDGKEGVRVKNQFRVSPQRLSLQT